MSDPKSRSGNVEAGCTRCARSPCVCGEGLQAWDAQRGRDAQAGRWSPSIVPDGVFTMRMEPPSPGPRPVSAEDAMKRANEACALAERAAKAAESGSLSTTHRSIIESLRHAHANSIGRIEGCEADALRLTEKTAAMERVATKLEGELGVIDSRLVALEGRRASVVGPSAGMFLGEAHNRLCGAVAGLQDGEAE